jgi:hypothetical protein
MRRIRLLALALQLGLVTACSGEGSPIDGPVIREPSGSTDTMSAEIHGRLELDGDCLYLYGDDGEERSPIVWSAGTTWDAERSEVVAKDGTRIAVGQEFAGGGGFLRVEHVRRDIGDDAGDHAAACVDNPDSGIAVVHGGIDISPAA